MTTTRITHASPAGIFANTVDRDWENDAEVILSGCSRDTNDDIAEQLVHNDISKKLKVMMGAGSRNFVSTTMESHGKPGLREDGKDLIKEWTDMNETRVYVSNRQELMGLDSKSVKQVLGLFNSDHLDYHLDIQRDGLQNIQPSLTDMTLKAIEILSQNENGYFLFVEGGRIDHGHHKNEARRAIDETVEFSKALEAALEKVDLEETLVVITADHGHVMTVAGYAVSFRLLVVLLSCVS